MRTSLLACLLASSVAVLALTAQSTAILPLEEVRPGMVGVGRTVYAGHELEEFQVTVLGVMRNVIGPRRGLILARLEGGPLAETGVIQGMSGSPVYVDGRLIGAVSYSIGSFPKEPIAGITPIEEMIADVDARAPRHARDLPSVDWPATPAEVFAAIGEIVKRASAPIGPLGPGVDLTGPMSLAELAPQLRPIGAALTLKGFEPSVAGGLAQAFDVQAGAPTPGEAGAPASARLRPGDPVGMALVRGDLEMGATGTVTHVDGSRVYAFGHPFLNLGPTQLAMTEAHVVTVLPSLSSSMKLASLGDVIGTVNQDRATAVGGTLGTGPDELRVRLTLRSRAAPPQRFEFFVANDPLLTPLFTYAALTNALTAWERQNGVMSLAIDATLSLGSDGTVEIDDAFSGGSALADAASAAASPLDAILANPYRDVSAEGLDIEIDTTEVESYTTIERAWLDTVRPEPGGTYTVHVQMRDYRGATRSIGIPVVMPDHVHGSLRLLVSDGPTLEGIERREIVPTEPASWNDVLAHTRRTRRNNRVYVRLIAPQSGVVVAGQVLPALPASIEAAVKTDPTTSASPVSNAIVGAWEARVDRMVRGSHELTIALESAR
jgi:hypothetical protein